MGSALRPKPGEFYRVVAPSLPLLTTSWALVVHPPRPALDREVAAVGFVFAALQIRQRISQGDWAPDYDQGEPLDGRTYHNIFSRCLVPDLAGRFVLRDSETKFIVVLVQGRAFRVDLTQQGKLVTRASLLEALRSCVAQAPSTPPAPCLLTAPASGLLQRVYPQLCASQTNLASLRTVSEALLVLCLDDAEPTSDEDTAFLLHAGTPHNRWYPFGVQLVVFRNGEAGVVGNFLAGLEGQPSGRVMSETVLAWAARPDVTPTPNAVPARVRPLLWEHIEPDDLAEARSYCDRFYRQSPENAPFLDFLPSDAARLGLDTRRAFLLVLQAALADEFGDLPPGDIYQMVALRHLEDKTYSHQSLVTPGSRAFAVALARGASRAELRAKLAQATHDYSSSLLTTRSFWNHDQLLHEFVDRLNSSPWRRPVGALLSHLPVPRELLRLSLLRLPPGLRLYGRFGVPSNTPSSVWAHPIFQDQGVRLVCSVGVQAVLSPPRLALHFGRVVERLRSLG